MAESMIETFLKATNYSDPSNPRSVSHLPRYITMILRGGPAG